MEAVPPEGIDGSGLDESPAERQNTSKGGDANRFDVAVAIDE
jgi:hypothetical protein